MTGSTRARGEGSQRKTPPRRSKGILSDLRCFFLHRPAVPTLIEFPDEAARENYSQRIMQRLGIHVEQYAILNIHRIGIEAPVRYVFEELLDWDGDSSCWPNHLATVERVGGLLDRIRIFLFGWRRYPFGLTKGILGLRFIPLFRLDAVKIQHRPGPTDPDNARYLLYACRGGYPIGVFALYVRSSVADQGEKEPTQMFLVVGFNFYGREAWTRRRLVNKIWETIHNRVTANTLNRFKQLCEWRFQRVQEGSLPARPPSEERT